MARGFVVSTADKNAKFWQSQIFAACAEALIINECYRFPKGAMLAFIAVFRMPTKTKKRWGTPHTSRPDIDNLIKLPMDVISKTEVMPEDSHVWQVFGCKTWSPPDQAGATFTIQETMTPLVAVGEHRAQLNGTDWLS